jgi:hypothetical protein
MFPLIDLRLDSLYPLPYDPVTNYTSLRPKFFWFDPNRRMEIMFRIERVMLDEEEPKKAFPMYFQFPHRFQKRRLCRKKSLYHPISAFPLPHKCKCQYVRKKSVKLTEKGIMYGIIVLIFKFQHPK